jgi:molybdate transport repressor ModE-like protein
MIASECLLRLTEVGQRGGDALLTEFGHAVVQHYRAVENTAEKAGAVNVVYGEFRDEDRSC